MNMQPIRVGTKLYAWDGTPGYVDLNSRGILFYQPGEPFTIAWMDADETEVEDTQVVTLEDFTKEGITRRRARMPWAR